MYKTFRHEGTNNDTRTHSIEHRIVSIHQPHVRSIVRGKSQAKVEFGAKIHLSLVDGISFLDELSWEAFNEGSHMMDYVERYRKRFGFYPKEVLADPIYCTRANRAALKEKGIRLLAKPLGRPSAVSIHLSPGERNPVEGKFRQAKNGYGLNRIRARLKGTSEMWIASIILLFNLVKLAGLSIFLLPIELAQRFSVNGKCLQFLFFDIELWSQFVLFASKGRNNLVRITNQAAKKFIMPSGFFKYSLFMPQLPLYF